MIALATRAALAVVLLATLVPNVALGQANQSVFERVRGRVVKIYGAGGFRGLEAYQTGTLISPDGYILTVWSYVLDTNFIIVTLDDGRRFEQATLVGFDPQLELAVLKIDADNLPAFNLEDAVEAEAGTRVLAFSNLYGVATGNEPVSMMRGVVAVKTRLEARRGVFETPYNGEVYVLDAVTNNPGAAGGVLTDRQGRILGMLGKELRNSLNNTWLNYAIPVSQFKKTVEDIIAGIHRPSDTNIPEVLPEFAHNVRGFGLMMVPDVLERTPPFVDGVQRKSAAERAGLRPNDLILFVNGRVIHSIRTLHTELGRIDRAEPVLLSIWRDQRLVEVELSLEEIPESDQ